MSEEGDREGLFGEVALKLKPERLVSSQQMAQHLRYL